jgi:hypothetical protein
MVTISEEIPIPNQDGRMVLRKDTCNNPLYQTVQAVRVDSTPERNTARLTFLSGKQLRFPPYLVGSRQKLIEVLAVALDVLRRDA